MNRWSISCFYLFAICFGSTLFVSQSLVGQQIADQQTDNAVEVFSGPQPGEDLPGFTVRSVLGETSGQDQNWVQTADQSPVVLIFVHQVNRQSISFTRKLTQYAAEQKTSGLFTGVVFLDADPSAGEEQIKRMQHALTPNVPTGISPDGIEGPGAMGLNRQAMLTIVIAEKQKVTANFALVQPSLAVDLPKVGEAIQKLVGGPALVNGSDTPSEPAMSSDSDESKPVDPSIIRPLLAPVIRRNATDEDIDLAAKVVEQRAAEDPAIKRDVCRIANTIIKAGMLEKYGTARTQHYLTKWSTEFADEKIDRT